MPEEFNLNDLVLDWCQGDVLANAPMPFVHLALAKYPITELSRLISQNLETDDEYQLLSVADKSNHGFLVVSQTCDVIRTWQTRPYLELAPLVSMSEQDLATAIAGKSSRFFSNRILSGQKLAADLDRIMTVEKSILMLAEKRRCCVTDKEQSQLRAALARKRSRFPFPDDFVDLLVAVRKRVISKHKKDTDEGQFLRNVREIRVLPSPNWEAPKVDLTFYFLFDTPDLITEATQKHADDLCGRFIPSTKYSQPEAVVLSLIELSAAVYLSSSALEFDFLSDPQSNS